ncbi:MAG: hypothetical protein HYZ37_16145 [Candidatus Solibacter usitatus]|nr:hypothetical protein [Candidatus Solibacter usitatus]
MIPLLNSFFLLSSIAFADSVTLVVSSETVPAGGMAQIKFSLDKPIRVDSGSLSVQFDPKFFGDVQSATAFSASGDVYGYAVIAGRNVELFFSVPSL